MLQASGPAPDDRLGYAAATDGNCVLAGAPETMGAGFDQGMGLLFEVPQLSMSVTPNLAALDDPIHLHVAGGKPGAKVGVFAFEVNGMPLFVPIYFALFSGDGTLDRFAKHDDPALSGLDIQIGALGSNGPGPVALSNLVNVELQ